MIGSFPGAITNAEFQKIQSKPASELRPYECIVQGITASSIQTPLAVARSRECLDPLVKREPGSATAWGTLSVILFIQRNWGFGFEQAHDVQTRLYLNEQILEAALKAVDLAPADPYARSRLATAYWASCQREPFRVG